MYYGPESTPLKGIAKTRSVYLPRGTTWIDFWTGKSERGGQTLESRATLDRIPLYVRAGSIVPMGPKIQFTGENELAPIELRIYPGADGEFTMYEDAGDGYDYEQGASSTYSLRWNQRKKELSIGARQGEFPEMIRQRTFHVVVVGEKRGVGLEESKRPDAKLTYDGLAVSIRL
jgi:alpha-D-xyloside xylohydrolase